MTNGQLLTYWPNGRLLLVSGGRLTIMVPTEHHELVGDLWRLAAGQSGMDDLLEWLVDRGFRTFESLTAVEFADSAPTRVLLRGAARLRVTHDDGSTEILSGEGRRTWLDTAIDDAAAIDTDPAGDAMGGLPLQIGTALAAAFAWPAATGIGAADLAALAAGMDDAPRWPAEAAFVAPGDAPSMNASAAQPPPDAPADPTPPIATDNEAPQDGTVAPHGDENFEGQTLAPQPDADEGNPDGESPAGRAQLGRLPADSTWDGADLTIDPFASAAPEVSAAAVIDIGSLPFDEPGPPDAFDQVFGATRKGTVEHAAVRESESEAEDVEVGDQEPPAQDQTPVEQPDLLGDHDGNTITSAELARLRGSLASAARASGPPPMDGSSVRAAVCSNGHPNPPNQADCRLCGIDLSSAVMQTVPRPVIGSLLFDDGQRVPLEGTIIVGRSPKAPMTPSAAIPSLISVQSPEHGVSRSHAEIRVEGWSASVVDLDSTNGTEVTLPGEQPRRLRRGEPCLITPGTVILLGDEVSARYEVAP